MATSTLKLSLDNLTFRTKASAGTTKSINFTDSGQYLVFATVNGIAYNFAGIINVYANGSVYVGELYKGSSLTISTSTRKLTITAASSQSFNINVFALTDGGSVSGVTVT